MSDIDWWLYLIAVVTAVMLVIVELREWRKRKKKELMAVSSSAKYNSASIAQKE